MRFLKKKKWAESMEVLKELMLKKIPAMDKGRN